jgi:hypothetical protein
VLPRCVYQKGQQTGADLWHQPRPALLAVPGGVPAGAVPLLETARQLNSFPRGIMRAITAAVRVIIIELMKRVLRSFPH